MVGLTPEVEKFFICMFIITLVANIGVSFGESIDFQIFRWKYLLMIYFILNTFLVISKTYICLLTIITEFHFYTYLIYKLDSSAYINFNV